MNEMSDLGSKGAPLGASFGMSYGNSVLTSPKSVQDSPELKGFDSVKHQDAMNRQKVASNRSSKSE